MHAQFHNRIGRTFGILIAICSALLFTLRAQTRADSGSAAPTEQVKLLQDFEGNPEIGRWPDDAKVEISTQWASDGKHSLKIYKGMLGSVEDMSTHDWSGYQILRFHCHVPGKQAVLLGIELVDKGPGYLNRHEGSANAAPGDSVVDYDISGNLWRGEVNHPYRALKTPLNKKEIQRFAVSAENGDVFIDQVELVKVTPLTTPGGYAFQFAPPTQLAQRDYIQINPATRFDAARGYGLSGGAHAYRDTTPYPTPVMGAGLTLDDAQFQVRLKGGKYIGWIIFERSGFWEDEQARYRRASLLANGHIVYNNNSDPAAAFFLLQDTEILNEDQLVNDMILPVQQVGDFNFDAADGTNTFTLTVDGDVAPRLAGLILAPDTPEGRAFIAAHKQRQMDTIRSVHRLTGDQQRAGDPAQATAPFIAIPLPSDAVIRPGDWPAANASAPVPPLETMAGLQANRLLGLYTRFDLKVTPALSPLVGQGSAAGAILPASAIHLLRNIYMPVRGYDQTGATIETHHYVPATTFTMNSTLARALLLQIDVPADAKPGIYTATLTFSCTPTAATTQIGLINVPITVHIHPGKLPDHNMCVGLFESGVPAGPEIIGDELYWKLSAGFLRQMQLGSLDILTGGPYFSLRWQGNTAVYSSDDAIKLIHLAKTYGLDMKLVEYGGFGLGVTHELPGPHGGMTVEQTTAAMAKGWEDLRAKNDLPEIYINSYDEPTTPSDFEGLEHRLSVLKAAGFLTNGYTSVEDPAKADADHQMLVRLTHAPAFGEYTPATLKWARQQGAEPWLYGGDLSRQSFGVDLWRAHGYGAAGRFGWIAAIVQGFQYDTLDGREPDPSCFYIHNTLGVLIAPRFLGVVEGGIDRRLLFALEHQAAGKDPQADAAKAIIAEVEAMPFRKPMSWEELEALRVKMFAALSAD